jgi:hypothetical protein
LLKEEKPVVMIQGFGRDYIMMDLTGYISHAIFDGKMAGVETMHLCLRQSAR